MDVYQQVTQSIIKAMGQNPSKVVMPWDRSGGGIPENAATKAHYNGVNIIGLWCEAQLKGFSSNQWCSYKQWLEIGAQVRKGEKSSLIVFYKQGVKENEAGETETFRIAKSYSVFNSDQVDGYTPPTLMGEPIDRIAHADEHVRNSGATIIHGGSQAFYRPSTDTIHMPDERRFFETEGYYSVLFHELTHFTGHPSRCNRDIKNRFGSEDYAFEELVAELGAAFQCAKLGISKEPRDDHAVYLNNWLTALKNEKKFIFSAAAKAQEACDYLFNCPSS
jgi:antirestriction protein ArdC